MAEGFKVWNLLGNEYLNHHPQVAAAAIAGALFLGVSVAYRLKAPNVDLEKAGDEAFVPSEKLGIRNILELPGEFIQGLAKDMIGHDYKTYMPLFIFVFLWTLLNNCLGVLPAFGSATDNLNATLAMGLVVFVYYNVMGFRAHGLKYLEHYTGHLHGILLLFLGPLMFLIEVISNAVRPVTLGIRLRTNIYADHTVYGIISGLFRDLAAFLNESFGIVGGIIGNALAVVGPLPIVVLGLLVCVIQAFVFTMLTMIYVGMATAHEEH
jgi:F-type H+-transporting ATPase subunit a